MVEYLERIFDFKLFISSAYEGTPQSFFENDSMWYLVQNALNYSKIFPSIQLLKLYNQLHIDLKFTCDSKHNILSQKKYLEKEVIIVANINWYPGHMAKAKRLMQKEQKNVDIVYELIDSRIPKSSKISNIYDIIGNTPKILIMTKKDMTDEEMALRWVKYYENLGSKVILADLNSDEDILSIVKLTHELAEEIQAKREEKGLLKKDIRVLVMGIPNVGKSTLINKMVGRKVAEVGNRPGVTKGLVWLNTPHSITLLDTPGILWPRLEPREVALNLASFSAIKTEVVDENEIAVHILNKLNKYYPDKLRERYGIVPNPVELDILAAYNTIARSMGAIRGGEVDYEKVSNRIINDIKSGYIEGVVFDHEF